MYNKEMDNRLRKIAEVIGKTEKIIDVGTDHGHLPVFLVRSEQVRYAIVSDVSKGSLRKAEILIKEKGLDERIEARLGSGLEVIDTEDRVDLAIIAGMGGNLIAAILEKSRHLIFESHMRLVLQPMQNPEALRRYLLQNGFCIDAGSLAEEDGRIYQIIDAKVGSSDQRYSYWELVFGRLESYKDAEQRELYLRSLKKKKKELENILSKISRSSGEDSEAYLRNKNDLLELEEMLCKLGS
ncbi:MAG: class I SAM-dependent methyltransferase [Peptostreptococcaceae bacterium]|nr:class I SAM-dependent methyltransferase [Peptostreptococcaceae bacterium]